MMLIHGFGSNEVRFKLGRREKPIEAITELLITSELQPQRHSTGNCTADSDSPYSAQTTYRFDTIVT